LPAALCSCTRLRHLELDGHSETCVLPPQISSLQHFEVLSIYGNDSTRVPAELGALTRLTRLELMGDDDKEDEEEEVPLPFPEELENLTSLRELKLEGHKLNAVPSFINRLTRLERLSLACNDRMGEAAAPGFGFAPEFPSMPRLTSLNLSGCYLTAVPPAVLSQMPALKVLNLSGNDLRILPNDLFQRLPELRELDLSETVFGAFPGALAGGAAAPPPLALTRLALSGCQLSSSVEQLRSMPALRSLDLSRNGLTALPVDLGQRLPQLTEIKLSINSFRAVPLAALSGATSLEKIELGLRPFQPDEALEVQLERLLGSCVVCRS